MRESSKPRSSVFRPPPPSADVHAASPGLNPSMSLSALLTSLANRAGTPISPDATAAVLGLGFMTCAAPHEADFGRWPLYGRDAFLSPAAARLGLTIRPLHPPDAALGLRETPGYRGHFADSYRPLILGALEHGQPVLAWCGWPGPPGEVWGLISGPCEDGIGLCGLVIVPGVADSTAPPPAVLRSPPVQCYVVEKMTPVKLDDEALLQTALDHACLVLQDKAADGCGITSGPAAYDAWVSRLVYGCASRMEVEQLARGHAAMASAEVAGRTAMMHFLQGYIDGSPGAAKPLLDTLIAACKTTVAALSESTDAASIQEQAGKSTGRRNLAEKVALARAAAVHALTALEARDKTNKPK